MNTRSLPSIPAKRYFAIGEVAELCGVKPHVLRYWEQEFTQLSPMKRRGNRRYYQHHEVLMVRRIRDLLYEQGFTISGARSQLETGAASVKATNSQQGEPAKIANTAAPKATSSATLQSLTADSALNVAILRQELEAIRQLLDG